MAFVDYQRKGNIAILTINRPDRRNAVGREVTADIATACQRFESEEEARVAIITGTGKAFIAGADVKELDGPPIPVQAFNYIEQVRKPTIAAVNGYCLGAGLLVMLTCDIRIAATSATFSLPEIARSIPLGPERLFAQNVPSAIVMELLLTGESITAQRAYEVGLINHVVPDEELMVSAIAMAEKIARHAPWVTRVVKEAEISALTMSKKVQAQEQERRLMARKSDDFKAAVKAFIDKK